MYMVDIWVDRFCFYIVSYMYIKGCCCSLYRFK